MSKGDETSLREKNDYVRHDLNDQHVSAHVILFNMVIPKNEVPEFKFVNHIDSDRLNNDLSNLEPSNHSHNAKCAHYEGVAHNSNHVRVRRTTLHENQKDINKEDIVEYKTFNEACKMNNLNYAFRQYLLKNGSHKHGNFLYERITDSKVNDKLKLSPMSDEEFKNKFKEIIEVKQLIKKKNKLTEIQTFSFPGYFISDDGTVCTLENNDKYIVRPRLRCGYWVISLCNNSKPKTFQVSRLVLIVHGKKNPITGLHINGITGKDVEYWNVVADHVDENYKNNSLSNLQWITHSENTMRSMKYKAFAIYNSKKEFVCVFEAIEILQNLLHLKAPTSIQLACRTGFKSTYLRHYFTYIPAEMYKQYKRCNNTIVLGPIRGRKGLIIIKPEQMDIHP